MSDLDLLREGGVVGGGGAGFPLWKKLSGKADILLINGAECEPLLLSDQYLMLHQAETLIRAAHRLKSIAGAQRVILCLKDHYQEQRFALETAIRSTALPVELHDLPTVYPIGDEQAVVHSATGRTVSPGGLPGEAGCAVVSVSTALNAWAALQGEPVTRRLLTVAGEVRRPGLYSVAIGTRLTDLVAAAGGETRSDVRFMLGGPMMGALVPKGANPAMLKTTGGVLAFPSEHPVILKGSLSMEHVRNRAKSVCIQCRTCTDLCPRFLLGHPIYPHLSMRAFAMGEKLEPSAALCMECGVCEQYACPMGLSPRRVQQQMKTALRAKGERPVFSPLASLSPIAASRHVPSSRIAARIGVAMYQLPLPASVTEVVPTLVTLPLRQHIGVPAQACVAVGDTVSRGQPIARMAPGALGADLHASIDGAVTAVTAEEITLERTGDA